MYQNLYNLCHLTVTQKEQETTSIFCNKECDKENKVQGMHVCVLLLPLKDGIRQTTHFARYIFFPFLSPTFNLKKKNDKNREADLKGF